MFKFLNVIPNVKYHIIVNNDNDLIYLRENTLYVNDIPILYGNNVFDFNALGKTVYIAENGMVNFKNYENNFQTRFNKSATVSFINENEALLYYGSDDYLKNYVGRFDIFNKSFKWEIEGFVGRGLIVNNYLFSGINNTFISKIDLDHPEKPLWQFDLSQLGTFVDNYSKETKPYKVEKFITIYNNQLYIALNLPSHTIISIDVQTGKLINKWENIPYTIGANYDEFEQIIFGFEHKNYWQINLKTSEFNIIDIENTFKQKNLKSVNSQVNIPINQTHYLIKLETPVDEENSRIDVGLGLYNKMTKQLDWHYVFDKNVFIGANDPKMTNDKIYQLDADGNLYIFEKEENEAI